MTKSVLIKLCQQRRKASYHTDKMRQRRGTSTSSNSDTPSSSSSAPKRPRGRPAIMGLVAMTPNTLRRRVSYLNTERRKKSRRVKKSKAAVSKRLAEDFESTTSETGESGSSENEEETHAGEEDAVEEENTDAVSRTTLWRAKCKLRGVLTGDAFDNMLLLLTFVKEYDIPDIKDELKKLDSLKSFIASAKHVLNI